MADLGKLAILNSPWKPFAGPYKLKTKAMIRTVADFLEALKFHHVSSLPDYSEIDHPVMFGDMYEGLTRELLKKAIFEGVDLRVVAGKIRNSKGKLSHQLDCMIVVGDGEQIPFTSHFIYPPERVVMIVEIKKTLYGAQVEESMALFQQFWAEVAEPMLPRTRILADAWRALCGTNLPTYEEANKLPFHRQMIYHTLVVESSMPLRVVFGYEGYVDELKLREGYLAWMEKIKELPYEQRFRLNLNTFPNLVVCRQASILKMDGLPYTAPMREDGYCCWLASSGRQPMRFLLEMLWTRLVPSADLPPSVFGMDLEHEGVNPFMFAIAINGQKAGWGYEYYPMNKERLKKGNDDRPWHPADFSLNEFIVMQQLCAKGDLDTSDPDVLDLFTQGGITVADFAAKLSIERLAALNGSLLELITDECVCAMLPDGRMIAGENKSGRLTRYAMKAAEEFRGKSNASGRATSEYGS